MTDPKETEAPNPADGVERRLEDEVRALHEELTLLREHRMFRLYQSVPRVLFFRLLTGMAVGLGTVIGATLLLSVIVWMLSQIEFIPIIGEWSAELVRQIESSIGNGQ